DRRRPAVAVQLSPADRAAGVRGGPESRDREPAGGHGEVESTAVRVHSRGSLRWGVDASLQHLGVGVRAEYVTRHVKGRDRARDDFGWYVFEGLRVIPRV